MRRHVINALYVWVFFLVCSNVHASKTGNALIEYSDMSPVENLFEQFSEETSLYEVCFIPDESGIEVTSKLYDGYYDVFFNISGKFEIEWTYVTNQNKIEGGNLHDRVKVDLRWGGDKVYRRLLPLRSIKSKEDSAKQFFLALGGKDSQGVLDLVYYGPFIKSDREGIRRMVSEIIRAKENEADDQLDPRTELLGSDNRWEVVLGLVILKHHEDLTAVDFISNPVLLSKDDMTILNDMFDQATSVIDVGRTLREAIKQLATNQDTDVAIAAVNHIAILAQSNIYNTRKLLEKDLLLFDEVIEEIASCRGAKDRLESILALKKIVMGKEKGEGALPQPGGAGTKQTDEKTGRLNDKTIIAGRR